MRITVKPSQSSIVSSSVKGYSSKKKVFAAVGDDEDDNDFDFDVEDSDTDELNDTLDDVADTVEDIQDAVDDVDEDNVDIEVDNNIANHYIAECEDCHGVFISAVIESDQAVDHISGVCPLCEKDTDQYLKWVVRDVKDAEE